MTAAVPKSFILQIWGWSKPKIKVAAIISACVLAAGATIFGGLAAETLFSATLERWF